MLSRSSHWSQSDLQSTSSVSNINAAIDNNSSESTSSSETLKWLGSMSDVSVSSHATNSSMVSGSGKCVYASNKCTHFLSLFIVHVIYCIISTKWSLRCIRTRIFCTASAARIEYVSIFTHFARSRYQINKHLHMGPQLVPRVYVLVFAMNRTQPAAWRYRRLLVCFSIYCVPCMCVCRAIARLLVFFQPCTTLQLCTIASPLLRRGREFIRATRHTNAGSSLARPLISSVFCYEAAILLAQCVRWISRSFFGIYCSVCAGRVAAHPRWFFCRWWIMTARKPWESFVACVRYSLAIFRQFYSVREQDRLRSLFMTCS